MPSIPEEPEVPENEMERLTMPDFIKPLYDLDVIEGKEAVLKCKVAGLPYPTIVWFHNGKRIDSTEDRKMTQCKSFFIRFDPPVVPKLKKKLLFCFLLQSTTSTVWSSALCATPTGGSTRVSFLTK